MVIRSALLSIILAEAYGLPTVYLRTQKSNKVLNLMMIIAEWIAYNMNMLRQ